MKPDKELNMFELIKDFCRYNLWANRIIITDTEPSLSQFALIEAKNSFSTIQTTLLHIMDAQMVWLACLRKNPITAFPSVNFSGSFSDCKSALIENSQEFYDFVSSQNESFCEEISIYKNSAGRQFEQKNGEIILHCMNHSTYHRGQIITLLRKFGQTGLPSTDYIVYLRQK